MMIGFSYAISTPEYPGQPQAGWLPVVEVLMWGCLLAGAVVTTAGIVRMSVRPVRPLRPHDRLPA